MKILLINKFLYPKGGAETYVLKLGEYLHSVGNEVQYFGMDNEKRTVSNRVDEYTTAIDFHNSSKFTQLTYLFKIIYSVEARKKIRKVLDDFKPDVCHLNNFNFQLTPSIILEIEKWRKLNNQNCKIIYTAHDHQLVCPNHMCHNPNTNVNCEKCYGGKFLNCAKGKCIHGSALRSVLGTIEAFYWNQNGVYKYIDKIICCSDFIKTKLDTNPIFASKTVTIHNFIELIDNHKTVNKKDYVLYFGRYSVEKGIETLISVAKSLPKIHFVFAGSGPLEDKISNVSNITNVGFKTGEELANLISEAKLTVVPSECYENCPFSVLESMMYGTPVLGANIGGIPELIENGKTGELFESGNKDDLMLKISRIYNNDQLVNVYSQNCREVEFFTIDKYTNNLLKEYSA